MGFKTYRCTKTDDQSWLLDMPEPLRFSGPNGLIARWYRSHKSEFDSRPWMMSAAAWIEMDFGLTRSNERWILLEQIVNHVPRYDRLEAINGIFGSETRLVLQFSPLEKVSDSPHLILRDPKKACGWGEELSIDGGDGSSTCSWRWKAPKLGFSSVQVG